MFGSPRKTRGGVPLAVVTGADHATGLGAGRALHQAGAQVWGVTARAEAPASLSRVWTKLLMSQGPPSVVATLSAGAAELERPAFLLPTDDRVVIELSRAKAALEDSYRWKLPSADIVRLFMEKTRFYHWATQHDLPLPDTRVVESESELKAVLSDMRYPLILKPLYRTEAWDERSPVQKALRLEKASDHAAIEFDLFTAAPAFVVSEWIEGPDDAVYYCLAYCGRPGEITASYSGRKLLQYPRSTGSTAICVGTKAGEVKELAETLFRAADFEGMGSLEVKYGRDGRPYITEPTVGRPNLQSYSAVLGGCNLPAVAMADALGMEIGPFIGRPKKSWWIQEAASLELLSPSQRGAPIRWSLIFRELATSERAGAAYAAWWDPLPFLSLFWGAVRRSVRYLFRRGRLS